MVSFSIFAVMHSLIVTQHGPPGCGKTSTIRLLAGNFDLDIYVISLSMSGMDDTLLGGLLTALPVRCIATIEDIDAAFTHGVNREESDSDTETTEKPFSTSQCKSRYTILNCSVSFSNKFFQSDS